MRTDRTLLVILPEGRTASTIISINPFHAFTGSRSFAEFWLGRSGHLTATAGQATTSERASVCRSDGGLFSSQPGGRRYYSDLLYSY